MERTKDNKGGYMKKETQIDLKHFLHMNEGDGELSYFRNSSVQNEVWLMNQHILENAISSILEESISSKKIHVADLGCGVGPVPLGLVSLVVEIIKKKCNELRCKEEIHHVPKIQIYMNDLPSNDYKLLFKDLQNLEILKRDHEDVPLCLFKAVPGSFYDCLFPHNTLHFVHSTYALHWLSQEPMELYNKQGEAINKGNIYISQTSEENVAKAYLGQFQRDFTQFLICRSKEVVSKGFMLLTTRGRQSFTNSSTWQPFELNILTNAITCLVHEV